ncbi:MAG: tRNA pseudouridine(55) synthase TruB [Microbacteriaceae bacterium]
MVSGIIVVDKPQGPSSHSVVSMARRALGTRKIGHAGTLDPMATGVLVLGVNTATRLLTYLVGEDKTYEATMRLGSTTVTDDAEGDTLTVADSSALAAVTEAQIAANIALLTGAIEQRPSAVSAIKVDGQRAYDRVRAGEDVVLTARAVRVERFDIHAIRRTADVIDLDVVVDCSSGTYIRALARDLGAALGVGGHLTALRRTRVGRFTIDRAVTPDNISEGGVVPSAEVAATLFPVWNLTADEERDIRHGKKVTTDEPDAKLVAAIREGGLVAIVKIAKGVARVETGFPE